MPPARSFEYYLKSQYKMAKKFIQLANDFGASTVANKILCDKIKD